MSIDEKRRIGMLKKSKNIFKLDKLKNENTKAQENTTNSTTISNSIEDIKKKLNAVFSDCSDFIIRECILKRDKIDLIVLVVFIEELIDINILNRDIIKPISNLEITEAGTTLKIIKQNIVSSSIKELYDFNIAVDDILSGNAILFIDGETTAFNLSIRNLKGREPDVPETEINILGPKHSFVEIITTNILLLRRIVKHPNLKVETLQIGSITKTEVAVIYIKGIANERIVNEVRTRLNKIKTDAIMASGYLEQFIEDEPFTLFPQVGNSERPDKVAANILEGRVGIICDGTPYVLTVPFLFIEAFQVSEDYYERPFYSTFLRTFRLFNFFTAISLPGIYVALSSFHQNVIPFQLMLTMMSSREGIPFSSFIEALLMITTFELIREASLRMPKPIGQTIGIIGAVVLGDAAVTAGIASAPMIVVTAVTALATFLAPPLSRALTLIRIITLIMASFMGIYGIGFTLVGFAIHLCKLRSFGVPYLSPISPVNITDLKDAGFRFPLWSLNTRPRGIIWSNDKSRNRIETTKKEEDNP